MRGARAAPLAPVAMGRWSTPTRPSSSSPPAWATRWRADLAGDGVPPARVDELVDGVARQDHRRARARARLPHLERPRPLPRRSPPTGRVGHGAALARRRGREPHGRRGRRRATRRAGWRRRSSVRRRRATRSASTPSGSRTRWSSSASRTPRTSAAPRPPVPLDDLRRFADWSLIGVDQASRGRGTSRWCAEAVVDVGPRLPAQVDRGAPGVERRPERAPRAFGSAVGRLGESGEPGHGVVELEHAGLRRRCRCSSSRPPPFSVARTNASTTSSTNTKSRVWAPSP